MKNLFVAVLLLGFATGAFASAEEKYNRYCVACHSTGAANAPKTGDTAAWEPRLAKGMDVLVESTTKGMGAMPPRGMCMECTPEDYKALIEYMSKPAE
ncbi:MAG: cytochrome c5 family protein [Halioglobus sp.]|nr:cytochrome c5 family protein [Halioglobus sp.]